MTVHDDWPDDADGDALRRVAGDGTDLSKPMWVDFMIAADDEEMGRRIEPLVRSLGYQADTEGDGTAWTVYCRRKMVLTYGAVVAAQAELDGIARPLGGHIDGWGTFGDTSPED